MAGLLSQLRRKLSGDHRKSIYSSNADRKQEPPSTKHVPAEPGADSGLAAEARENRRASTFERTQDIVNKDDFLLQQIDDFRDRAQQLQNLMNSREAEVRRMEQMRQMNAFSQTREPEAGVRTDQLQHLEQLLLARDENTAELTAEVERKIDEMIDKVGAKLDELDESVRKSAEGTGSESRKHAEELKASLEQIQSQLETLKADLSDKVHKENVTCYRNIQDLCKSLDTKLEKLEPLKGKTDSTRSLVIVTMIFTLINFIAVLGMLLLQLGVFAI